MRRYDRHRDRGLAPFVSMIKQLHHDNAVGHDGRMFALLHTNRTTAELGYHQARRVEVT